MEQAQIERQNEIPAAAPVQQQHQQQPSVQQQLAAYNSAFVELGLRFRWDEAMYGWLCGVVECERTRIAHYIETYHAHLLTAYDAPFLSQLILEKKNAYLEPMSRRAS